MFAFYTRLFPFGSAVFFDVDRVDSIEIRIVCRS